MEGDNDSEEPKLLEKESVAKPKPKSQVRKTWEEYKAAEGEAEMATRQLEEQAKREVEQDNTTREEQVPLQREEGLRQAMRRAKEPVQAPQPVPEEKDDAMEEDEEEGEGTRETPIEVVAEVVASREVPKPVDVRRRPRVEERTMRTLPTRREGVTTAMGAVDSQEPGRTLKIEYSEWERLKGPRADRTEN